MIFMDGDPDPFKPRSRINAAPEIEQVSVKFQSFVIHDPFRELIGVHSDAGTVLAAGLQVQRYFFHRY